MWPGVGDVGGMPRFRGGSTFLLNIEDRILRSTW